ncbi:MAG: hypothetical protein H6740_14290 [Alphaproteobacteria bacterium]|nr:hypothetical protein [Alphaproteobacteria bacterium]
MAIRKGQAMVMLTELMRRPGGVRVADALHLLDIDPRTLRRYLSELRELGYQIDDSGALLDRTLTLTPDRSLVDRWTASA